MYWAKRRGILHRLTPCGATRCAERERAMCWTAGSRSYEKPELHRTWWRYWDGMEHQHSQSQSAGISERVDLVWSAAICKTPEAGRDRQHPMPAQKVLHPVALQPVIVASVHLSLCIQPSKHRAIRCWGLQLPCECCLQTPGSNCCGNTAPHMQGSQNERRNLTTSSFGRKNLTECVWVWSGMLQRPAIHPAPAFH